MKKITAIVIVMFLAQGCWFTRTKMSGQGGTTPMNEEFSISVPTSTTVDQGETEEITISLNRGDYFKRDVQLELDVKGVTITPKSVLVRASDQPEVKVQIAVPQNAALGSYSVSVTATPTVGNPVSTTFVVKVVPQ